MHDSVKYTNNEHDPSTWPERIQKLPRDKRGYPIPFTTFIDLDGNPDFRILDADRRFECYESRLCGICGDVLGYWMIFIGGPRCEETRMFLDPPMHPECADFALAVCPHLVNAKARYSQRPTNVTVHEFSTTRPEVFKRFRTRGYELVRMASGGDIILHSQPFSEVITVKFKKGA